MENDHLTGHKSLAEMVSTHIEVWRDGLKFGVDKASDADERSYFEHELKALEDIEKACKVEMAK